MDGLIGLIIAVVLVLFGVDVIRNRESSKAERMAEELDARETREAATRARARERVRAAKERIQDREDAHVPLEADTPDDAADRLRREFGTGG